MRDQLGSTAELWQHVAPFELTRSAALTPVNDSDDDRTFVVRPEAVRAARDAALQTAAHRPAAEADAAGNLGGEIDFDITGAGQPETVVDFDITGAAPTATTVDFDITGAFAEPEPATPAVAAPSATPAEPRPTTQSPAAQSERSNTVAYVVIALVVVAALAWLLLK